MFNRKGTEDANLIKKADLDPGKYERDLIFYAIAAYEGYRLSAKKLTQADYAKISQMP